MEMDLKEYHIWLTDKEWSSILSEQEPTLETLKIVKEVCRMRSLDFDRVISPYRKTPTLTFPTFTVDPRSTVDWSIFPTTNASPRLSMDPITIGEDIQSALNWRRYAVSLKQTSR